MYVKSDSTNVFFAHADCIQINLKEQKKRQIRITSTQEDDDALTTGADASQRSIRLRLSCQHSRVERHRERGEMMEVAWALGELNV